MKTVKTLIYIACILAILPISVKSQNLEELLIERIKQSAFMIPEGCTPDDIIIVVNSAIPELTFESNMLPREEYTVTWLESSNQYVICHERLKFKLTVSGPNLKSADLDIFDVEEPHFYNISANTVKGTVNINTNPGNSTVIFPGLRDLAVSSNTPITNVSGKYPVKIVKANYKSIDTTITIPRNAEQNYYFDLVPEFPRIQISLKTEDNLPFTKIPVMMIDSVRVDLDALVKPGQNLRRFYDELVFFKFYEGNFIPVPEGTYNVKITTEGYTPFETRIQTRNGRVNNLSVTLEPIYGYITFIDRQNAEGSKIYINEQLAGTVPVLNVKTKVGVNRIRFEKQGFIPVEKEFTLEVKEKQNIDFEVYMQIARKINFVTEPGFAEIHLNGARIGFTPFSTVLNEGKQSFLIRKNGFATEIFEKEINVLTPDEETIHFKLRPVSPLEIKSEMKGLQIVLKGMKELKNIETDNVSTTPANVDVPYGKYQLRLLNSGRTVYRGSITHHESIIRRDKLPAYSPSSFHFLTANYFTGMDGINLDASFGRIHLFSKTGLSTSLINIDYRQFTGEVTIDTLGTTRIDTFRTVAPHLFLMNWDWRIGGSVLRQLDVCLLGQAKFTPGLHVLNLKVGDFTDVSMERYFVGMEISTRVSFLNLNLRFGQQFYNGKIHLWDEADGKYTDTLPVKSLKNDWVFSAGLTLNGPVYKSNNMLRLWHQPLVDPAKRTRKVVPAAPAPEGQKVPFYKSLFKKK